MTTLHFITYSFPPSPGGLEEWTLRLARMFSLTGYEVCVYTMDDIDSDDYYTKPDRGNIQLKLIQTERTIWEEPIKHSLTYSDKLQPERNRLNFVIIRNLIQDLIRKNRQGKHIIISNSIAAPGFLATLLSEELNIPHIAIVTGTDFSRGFRNLKDRQAIEMIIKLSSRIVTKNNEQATAISRNYHVKNIYTIHTAIDSEVLNYSWSAPVGNNIALFSDNGYSHKKGTQVLMWAFKKLVEEKFPVTLTICGSIMEGQEAYWDKLKQEYVSTTPGITFLDHISKERLWDLMSHSAIYCSPTVGEGSSHSRATALCIGMPVVTTNCGEIADVAASVSHIRLSALADSAGFLNELRQLCLDVISGSCQIDHDAVDKWRAHFALEQEFEKWKMLIKELD